MRAAKVVLVERPDHTIEGECTVKGDWLHCRISRRINTGIEFEETPDGVVPRPQVEVRVEQRSWSHQQVLSVEWLDAA